MNARKSRERRRALLVTAGFPGTADAYRRQPYIPKFLAAAKDAEPGTVTHVYIAHDSWCLLLAGGGPCSCKPEITARRDGDVH